MKRWLRRLPSAIIEFQAVLGVRPFPGGVSLLSWEIATIKGLIEGPFQFLARSNPARADRPMNPYEWGELVGTGLLYFTLLGRPSDEALKNQSEFPEVEIHRAKLLDQTLHSMGPVLQAVMAKFEFPSLAAHREFAKGYLSGLYSEFDDDGVTMKNDSEKHFLLFLFWMHREELRPGLVGSISDVHKWVNEVSSRPISLANVRKVANLVGLKLAGVGKPARKLRRRQKKA